MAASCCIPALALIALLCGASAATAQSAVLMESVQPNGAIAPSLALTPTQRSAIYNSVKRQLVTAPEAGIAASVGSPVPPSRALPDLPDVPVLGGNVAGFLKYAMVGDDVVVVDPIRMRVVEVIHSGAGP